MGIGKGCSGFFRAMDYGPHRCVLQAGRSEQTCNLMRTVGNFKPSVVGILADHFGKALKWTEGLSPPALLDNWYQPDHTGEMNLRGEIDMKKTAKGYNFISHVFWENGGLSNVNISMTAAAAENLKKDLLGPRSQEVALEFIQNWLQDQMKEHTGFLKKNRLMIWAGEQAEFAQMCDKFAIEPIVPQLAPGAVSPGGDRWEMPAPKASLTPRSNSARKPPQ